MIASGSIKIYSQFAINRIVDMEMDIREGCHGKLILRGYTANNHGNIPMSNDAIRITCENDGGEQEDTLFEGVIQETHIFMENGVKQVILKATTNSIKLDRAVNNRSFQDTSMTGVEIIGQVLSKYKGKVFCGNPFIQSRIPMVQYGETDWEFCRRVSSCMEFGIFCDESAQEPVLKIGLPEGGKEVEFSEDAHMCGIEESYYHNWKECGVPKAEFLYYEVETEENYSIGDFVSCKGQIRYIYEKRAELKDDMLVFYYKLGGIYHFKKNREYNRKLSGLSLPGEVVKTEDENVFLKLDIDGLMGKSCYPYPWMPVTGNMMYSMPLPETRAYLYFPDCHEERAFAVNSIRTNETSICFGNPQDREFVTEYGKRMQLYATEICFQGGEGDRRVLFSMNEENCVLRAGGKLSLISREKIMVKAPYVSIRTPLGINQLKSQRSVNGYKESFGAKGSRNPATGGEASLSMQYEFRGLAEQGILYGTEYERYIPFDDAPEYEKNYPTWLKICAGAAVALLVSVVFGALTMLAVAVAPVVAPFIVLVGAIATISGLVALGSAVAEEKQGENISMGEYISRVLSGAVSLNTAREIIGALKGEYSFQALADETELGKLICYVAPHLPNQIVTGVLQLTTFAKISEDEVNANASNNSSVLKSSSQIIFIPGQFIENQVEWTDVNFGTTQMSYSGCEIISVYNAQLALGYQMTADEMVELISRFERSGALLKGEFGTSWIAIADYFEEKGYDVVRTYRRDSETINSIGESNDTIIVTAFNDKDDAGEMIHTICITKDEDGYYTLHNAYKQDAGNRYVSFSGKEEGGQIEYIETLEEAISYISKGNAVPVQVIGISKSVSKQRK